MIRFRRHLGAYSACVTALFALALAVPRAALVHHQHRGGDHAHVHADLDDASFDAFFAELHEHHHHHGHDHAHPHPHQAVHQETASPTGPTWRVAGEAGGGHWHQQQRYQRALVA